MAIRMRSTRPPFSQHSSYRRARCQHLPAQRCQPHRLWGQQHPTAQLRNNTHRCKFISVHCLIRAIQPECRPGPAGTPRWLQRYRTGPGIRGADSGKSRSGSRIKVLPSLVRGPGLRSRERPPFTPTRPGTRSLRSAASRPGGSRTAEGRGRSRPAAGQCDLGPAFPGPAAGPGLRREREDKAGPGVASPAASPLLAAVRTASPPLPPPCSRRRPCHLHRRRRPRL